MSPAPAGHRDDYDQDPRNLNRRLRVDGACVLERVHHNFTISLSTLATTTPYRHHGFCQENGVELDQVAKRCTSLKHFSFSMPLASLNLLLKRVFGESQSPAHRLRPLRPAIRASGKGCDEHRDTMPKAGHAILSASAPRTKGATRMAPPPPTASLAAAASVLPDADAMAAETPSG